MRRAPVSQGGAALLLFTAILGAVTLSFVIGYSTWYARERNNNLKNIQWSYVSEVGERARDFYIANAADVDDAGGLTVDELINGAGLDVKWDLQLEISNPLVRGDVEYRTFAFWLPGDSDENPPVFDPDTGAFLACADIADYCPERPFIVVDGYPIQSENVATTKQTLSELANFTQSYFKSKWLGDPDRNVGINWFRAPFDPVGCNVTGDEIPCVDDYEPVETSGVADALLLPNSAFTNAWGDPIEVSNLADARAAAVPYTMVFRTTTPWGEEFRITAVQPL
jgi:hypothetical protein